MSCRTIPSTVRRAVGDGGRVRSVKPENILKGTLLFAAFASFLLSVIIYFNAGDDTNGRLNGIFIGVWVPSILALGTFLLAHRRTPQ